MLKPGIKVRHHSIPVDMEVVAPVVLGAVATSSFKRVEFGSETTCKYILGGRTHSKKFPTNELFEVKNGLIDKSANPTLDADFD